MQEYTEDKQKSCVATAFFFFSQQIAYVTSLGCSRTVVIIPSYIHRASETIYWPDSSLFLD